MFQLEPSPHCDNGCAADAGCSFDAVNNICRTARDCPNEKIADDWFKCGDKLPPCDDGCEAIPLSDMDGDQLCVPIGTKDAVPPMASTDLRAYVDCSGVCPLPRMGMITKQHASICSIKHQSWTASTELRAC